VECCAKAASGHVFVRAVLLSRGRLQRRAVKHLVFKLKPRTLPHQAEGVPALGAFVLQHVVPVLHRLDADQGSFEVAGHADRCRRHVRRLFPVMVVRCRKLYRGRFARRVNLPNRTNTGRMNTGAGAGWGDRKRLDKWPFAFASTSASRATPVNLSSNNCRVKALFECTSLR